MLLRYQSVCMQCANTRALVVERFVFERRVRGLHRVRGCDGGRAFSGVGPRAPLRHVHSPRGALPGPAPQEHAPRARLGGAHAKEHRHRRPLRRHHLRQGREPCPHAEGAHVRRKERRPPRLLPRLLPRAGGSRCAATGRACAARRGRLRPRSSVLPRRVRLRERQLVRVLGLSYAGNEWWRDGKGRRGRGGRIGRGAGHAAVD